jgi:hypothetical protein
MASHRRHASFNVEGVGINSILKRNIRSKPEHRTNLACHACLNVVAPFPCLAAAPSPAPTPPRALDVDNEEGGAGADDVA